VHDAGAVEKHVHITKLSADFLGYARDGRFVGHIELARANAFFTFERLDLVADVGRPDLCAFAREGKRRSIAHALCCRSNECGLSRETSGHVIFLGGQRLYFASP